MEESTWVKFEKEGHDYYGMINRCDRCDAAVPTLLKQTKNEGKVPKGTWYWYCFADHPSRMNSKTHRVDKPTSTNWCRLATTEEIKEYSEENNLDIECKEEHVTIKPECKTYSMRDIVETSEFEKSKTSVDLIAIDLIIEAFTYTIAGYESKVPLMKELREKFKQKKIDALTKKRKIVEEEIKK